VNKRLFERLVESMGQMGEIAGGTQPPSHEFWYLEETWLSSSPLTPAPNRVPNPGIGRISGGTNVLYQSMTIDLTGACGGSSPSLTTSKNYCYSVG
jgi:hypothetical protein